MTTADPLIVPTAWDFMTIGGVPTPGRCEVSDAKRNHNFDKKKGKGLSGATTTFTQKPPAEFKVKFYLWDSTHFAAWEALFPLLRYDPEKGIPVFAVDVYHPSLSALEISSCVVQHLGLIEHLGEQLYAFDVGFLEYRPPPPASAVSTPSQSGDSKSPDSNVPDPQIVALNAQIAALTAQAQKAYAP